MPAIEVFKANNEDKPFLIAEFPFLPRLGEYLAIENDGYFQHYNVMEVWHRKDEASPSFQSCILVELTD